MAANSSVSDMFDHLIRLGHIRHVEHMENLSLPGAFPSVPSILTYGTPDIPVTVGAHLDAELEQRFKRNISTSGYEK